MDVLSLGLVSEVVVDALVLLGTAEDLLLTSTVATHQTLDEA